MQGPLANQGTAPFVIDMREVLAYAYKLKGADATRIIRVEMAKAVKAGATQVRDKANARVKSRSGKLTGSAKVTTSVVKNAVRGTVTWFARSEEGFPYPIVQESGHKAFGPKNAPILAWQDPPGTWHRAMWVKAWPGTHFASKGLEEAAPFINAEAAAAIGRIVSQVEAL
jgi:ribosomal protein L31E